MYEGLAGDEGTDALSRCNEALDKEILTLLNSY
jgi:hypothetical protein